MNTSARRLGRFLAWHRRWLAICATACAVYFGLQVLAPPPPPTQLVVVARHDLPGGRTITADDLDSVHRARDALPDRTVLLADVVGKVLAAPVSRGTTLTEVSVIDPRRVPAGRVLAPVRVTDAAVASLVRIGDTVDVIGLTDESGAGVIARGARVSTVLAGPTTGSGALDGGEGTGTTLLVEVTSGEAAAIAVGQNAGALTVSLR